MNAQLILLVVEFIVDHNELEYFDNFPIDFSEHVIYILVNATPMKYVIYIGSLGINAKQVFSLLADVCITEH